jgi:hypothetical protein
MARNARWNSLRGSWWSCEELAERGSCIGLDGLGDAEALEGFAEVEEV